MQQLAGSRWPLPMMDNPDFSVLMLGAKSQADCMSCAISLQAVATVAESLVPEGGGVWRCLAVEKLSQVELDIGAWYTEPRSKRQTCIDEIDFDIDAQLGGDPQKGP
jgi:hypothetical protein